jgi:hypothetical protein
MDPMQNRETEHRGPKLFEGSDYWQSNVRIAAGAGLGACILVSVVCAVALWINHTLSAIIHIAGFFVLSLVGFLLLFPGNGVAQFPSAVEIDEGRGICLYALFKRLYIPIDDIRDIRKSFYRQGYVVRLKRRHRLLTKFIIHWFFGEQAEPLANAIREEIQRRASYGH